MDIDGKDPTFLTTVTTIVVITGTLVGAANSIATIYSGGIATDAAKSFAAGFVIGFVSIILGATGGVPAAGVTSGLVVNIALTTLSAPFIVPDQI